MRLNKYLAHCGVTSRRHADEIISAGRVKVNGETVSELGVIVDEEFDRIEVDGNQVKLPQAHTYVALNKPRGVIVTAKDERGRDTVRSLLRGLRTRVNHVGRLDQDSEGLLLLTNDGELAFRLTHPKYEIAKTYRVIVSGQIQPTELSRFSEGIELDDGHIGKAEAKTLQGDTETTVLKITLREGRKREIRQMCKALGHPVKTLQRLEFGGIELGKLPPGQWRYLTDEEVRMLKRDVGLV
jgi:23S rRNA pseudouridine2605 synthase